MNILVNPNSLISFKADHTENVNSFEEVSRISKKLLDHYTKCYFAHNFSFRILLPRSIESPKTINLSKKLGLHIQNELLNGVKKSKLRLNIREFRYIHDLNHYGWLLIDPSFSHNFD